MNRLPVHGPIRQIISMVVLGDIASPLKGDEEFEFLGPDGKLAGKGQVTAAWAGPLSILPASLLEQHFDPSCRTYSGLVLTLRLLHGEKAVPNDKVVVSALQFKLTGGEILIASSLHKV